MRRRSLIIIAGAVVVLLLGATAAVSAYDNGRRGEIAEGVKVNGVDVGGLGAAAARAKLRDAVLRPLARPVSVRYHGERFTLTPRQAAVGVDIDGSVQAALDRSREGTMFSRAWRDARG